MYRHTDIHTFPAPQDGGGRCVRVLRCMSICQGGRPRLQGAWAVQTQPPLAAPLLMVRKRCSPKGDAARKTPRGIDRDTVAAAQDREEHFLFRQRLFLPREAPLAPPMLCATRVLLGPAPARKLLWPISVIVAPPRTSWRHGRKNGLAPAVPTLYLARAKQPSTGPMYPSSSAVGVSARPLVVSGA